MCPVYLKAQPRLMNKSGDIVYLLLPYNQVLEASGCGALLWQALGSHCKAKQRMFPKDIKSLNTIMKVLIGKAISSDLSQWLIFLDTKWSIMDLVYSGKLAINTLKKHKSQSLKIHTHKKIILSYIHDFLK